MQKVFPSNAAIIIAGKKELQILDALCMFQKISTATNTITLRQVQFSS